MEMNMTIAIDGPASSGKSTVSKQLAQALNFIHIDTGAMYRSLTLAALEQGLPLSSEQELVDLLEGLDISFKQEQGDQHTYINGQDVSQSIRSLEVTNNVSEVSTHPKVREELVNRQRQLAEKHSVIMDGRDIGTVVLPEANYKFFLDASVDERARRRHEENLSRGINSDYDQLRQEIILRDQKDSQRTVAPLKPADDAIMVDTTTLTIDQVIERIRSHIGR